MRCVCCNKPLTNYEMSLKGKLSGEHLYMALSCIKDSGIAYTGNAKLKTPSPMKIVDLSITDSDAICNNPPFCSNVSETGLNMTTTTTMQH